LFRRTILLSYLLHSSQQLKMPSLPASSTALMEQVQDWVRTSAADPFKALHTIPFKTVGLVGAAVIFTILIIDLLGYLFATFEGSRRSYVPFSRSMLDAVTDAWDDRHSNFIGDYYDPYARSLEPMTNTLDSLSLAWKKWGRDAAAGQWEGGLKSRLTASDKFVFSQ